MFSHIMHNLCITEIPVISIITKSNFYINSVKKLKLKEFNGKSNEKVRFLIYQ